MGRVAVGVLKVIIAIALAGSLVVQGGTVPVFLLVFSGDDWPWAFVFGLVGTVVILTIVCLQVIAVCIWRLLTRVRAGTVFSPRSFREVDTVIGAIAAGAVIATLGAVGLAIVNRTTQEDVVAPGQVGLVLGFALVAGGVALVVYVMRLLLVQAIELDASARELRAELDEVI